MQGKLHHVEQRKTYCEGCFILEWDLTKQLHKDEGRYESLLYSCPATCFSVSQSVHSFPCFC